MYDDTVSYADWNDCDAFHGVDGRRRESEPRSSFCLARAPESSDPVAVLEATEWYALGFRDHRLCIP